LFIRPGRNTACTLEMGGRRYLFCSEPCRWIFEQERSRFADHHSVVDRIVAGQAPGKLTDLHRWMGLEAPVETGKDLRRGLDPWRLDPIPTA
jgi:toluene monooxygenase system protein A